MSHNIKRYWALILPVIVMAAGLMIFKSMTFDGVVISVGDIPGGNLINSKTVGYPYWMAAGFLLLFMTSVAAVVFTVRDVYLHNSNGTWVVFCWVAVLLFTVVFFALTKYVPENLFESLGKGVFENSVAVYLVSVGYVPGTESCQALCPLKTLIDGSNALAVGAAAVIVCGIATLHPPDGKPENNFSAPELQNWIDNHLNDIAGRMQRLKYLLLAATSVLVSGVIFMTIWRGWPNVFDFTDRETYKALADSSVQFQAFHFALILATIFIPMAVVLKQRANDIVAFDPGLNSDTARKTFLTERGVRLDFKSQAMQLLTILSPYLVSGPLPMVELIDFIKAGF